ncbi:MAG: hypothetical protein KDK08_29605 [Rhizobiaceae bacterium]|nr:hypothetical protein [Rhizobiaceae bacterium]
MKFLSKREVLDRLKIADSDLAEYCRQGIIEEPQKDGCTLWWRQTDIDAAIEQLDYFFRITDG